MYVSQLWKDEFYQGQHHKFIWASGELDWSRSEWKISKELITFHAWNYLQLNKKVRVFRGVTYQNTRNLIPAMYYLKLATSNTEVALGCKEILKHLFIGLKISDSLQISWTANIRLRGWNYLCHFIYQIFQRYCNTIQSVN